MDSLTVINIFAILCTVAFMIYVIKLFIFGTGIDKYVRRKENVKPKDDISTNEYLYYLSIAEQPKEQPQDELTETDYSDIDFIEEYYINAS